MRIAISICVLCAVAAFIFISTDFDQVTLWAAEQQRVFQNQMAGAVRALKSGDPGALTFLLAAAGAYGFVHAVGPGHGKYLIGGVGIGTSVPMARLLGLSLVSSLAQSFWAILLVYGGFFLLEASAHQMRILAEDYLAPASYLAIATVGIVLAWRGAKSLGPSEKPKHHAPHQQHECGCHSHGPTPDEVAKLGSWREVITLVTSIAIRPCTGAIFLLVIAWQMDLLIAGAAAVIFMGLGTACLTGLVAVSSVFARGIAFASANGVGLVPVVLSLTQIIAGGFIVWISMVMLKAAL